MSLNGFREDVATALSGVDDVTGYAKRPSAPKTGDAWTLLGGLERDAGDPGFTVTWVVLILLPPDEVIANDWIDNHAQDIFDALQPLAYVERFTPVALQVNNSEHKALQIEMRSE